MTDLIIEHLAARGDGVAHDAAREAIYVPFSAPGDHIKRVGEGYVVSKKGVNRQPPVCAHYGECGGCVLQHVDAKTYQAWLGDRIAAALDQQGLKTEILSPDISPPGSRRRAALQAQWVEGRLRLGFSEKASNQLVDLDMCPVMRPELVSLTAPLREMLSCYLPQNRAARAEMLLAENGVDLLLTGLDAEDRNVSQALVAFADDHDIARIACAEGKGAWGIVIQRRTPVLAIGPVDLPPPPGVFCQATKEGENALIAAVLDGVGHARQVADLFAGIGTFAFPLAQHMTVHAVEGSRIAIRGLEAGRRAARGIKPISVEHRDLFRRPLRSTELASFDAVVFDPPRAGAKEQSAQIAQSRVKKVVAVSCNPNTFARDAKLLVGGGYKLAWVKPVGQFLWSAEVELVALFKRP